MINKHTKHPTRDIDKRRIVGIALCLFVLMSLLIVRYYVIQIVEGDMWSRVARRQHLFVVREPFVRGSFYTNASLHRAHPDKPQKLVTDISKFHLYVDPESIPVERRNDVAQGLKSVLMMTQEEQEDIRGQLDRKSRSRKLVMWLDQQAKDNVIAWWNPFARQHHIPRNALFFVSDYQRSYPYGKLLGQVLHTVQKSRDEATGKAHPTGGLELQFDKWLSGKQGKRRMMRSPRNSFEIGEVISQPENGADVYLTINHGLQAIAEEEIALAVRRTKAKAGWAVMMDPYTGEILALAQYPYFYPAAYTDYFNDPDKREDTKVKAVTDAQEPGSVMKAITLTVAMLANEELRKRGETELFSPEEKVDVSDDTFPGRRPLKEIHYHKALNMNMGMQRSSNIYMARMIQRVVDRLGTDWYRGVLNNVFGFGKKTGIELPGESAGLLPLPGKLHPNGALEWSTPTPFSLAIGHNIQVTSFQLLRAYALLANGGKAVQPTLIRKIVKGDEVILDNTLPEREESFPTLLDSKIADRIVTSMKYVTKKGGSALRADIPGYTEVGKTGTAEKIVNGTYSKKEHVTTFIGFTPVVNPAFVLVVTLDDPDSKYQPGAGKRHYGGLSAAPAFREIGKRSLAYLGVPPDDPHGYPVGDPRYDVNKADWAKEVAELQELYEKWNAK